MSDLTKEQYDAEYDAEMERLNAEAAKEAITPTEAKPEEVVPEPEKTPEPIPPAPAVIEDTPETPREKEQRERIEKLEKSLNDTKKWANDSRLEAKKLRQEQEERDRQANRPTILDDNPGLEEAIRYAVPSAAPAPAPQANPVDDWAATLARALPELDALLETNTEFKAKAEAVAKRLGSEWSDPIIAIRELTKLQTAQVGEDARKAAQVAFQLKSKKQAAMQMPGGGSGGHRTPAPVDEAERIRTMSTADFEAMKAKAKGYS